ncbi:MAG: hypothetical protein KF774_05405 [Planctomyces sp.]|nr:hypothetical protein [Planctomyces sp.]
MHCPRCQSRHVRRSKSLDSAWRRILLQQQVRCHRCSHVFAAPIWATPEEAPPERGRAGARSAMLLQEVAD